MGLFDLTKKKDAKNISQDLLDKNKVSIWIDDVLKQDISEDIKGICFNLYDDGEDKWSMELVGTRDFDIDDSDWACEEITNFGTRTNPFVWHKAAPWDKVLEEMILVLKEYLENGKYAKILKSQSGIGVGFTDGELEILYSK